MSSSEVEPDTPDLICQLDNIQGMVDALSSVQWKRHQVYSLISINPKSFEIYIKARSVDSPDACIYGGIRTRIPDTISWDYNYEPAGSTLLSFTVKSAALKGAIDDLEWPGSSIQIVLQPNPPCVLFRGEGHGYKYKFLQATSSNMPGSVIKDNRGSKLTIGRGGMLKVQHLVSVARPPSQHPQIDSAARQLPSRIAYIEFFVKPEVDEEPVNDA